MYRLLKYLVRRQISRVSINPGDVIVFRAATKPSEDEARDLLDHLGRAFPGHRVILLTEDARLQVVPHTCSGCGGRMGDETEDVGIG